ncbi:MAG TPA: S41 family peptidase [Steroidobacteraceae bacterium]|nr:S41 family peptidase [Steroidobacteraceae bacterium]
MPRLTIMTAVVAGAVLGVTGSLALMAVADRAAPHSVPVPAWQQAHLFAEVYERIKNDYVDEVDDQKLFENAVRGMAEGLDSHSTYLNGDEYDDMQRDAEGEYPGVGIEVAPEDGAVKILSAMPGSPAARAGLRAGDVIARIDGAAIGGDVDAAIAHLRGEVGTPVHFTVDRPGAAAPLEVTLVRERIEVHSVQSQPLAPGYGYVRITGFSDTTAGELEAAVARLRHGAALRGLVLDLRGNPGGVLEAGVAVADDFLDRGVIVTADGRTRDARFRMEASAGDVTGGAPLVVLVDGGTASAAEILAGALKDHARALLIGTRTYGKGTVQTVLPLSQGALKLTTSRYFTPAGSSIDERGILPDLPAPGMTSAAVLGDGPDAAGGSERAGDADAGNEGAQPSAPEPSAVPPQRDSAVRFALELLRSGRAVQADVDGLPAP